MTRFRNWFIALILVATAVAVWYIFKMWSVVKLLHCEIKEKHYGKEILEVKDTPIMVLIKVDYLCYIFFYDGVMIGNHYILLNYI